VLNKKIEAAMNDQLQKELQSAYVYLAMSAYTESLSLPGMSQWLRAQWEEELAHAMRFYNFIVDRGARVSFKALDAPPADYKSPLNVFETALEHERAVTRSINDLYELVADEKDFASQAWLDWFATEQVEEEKSVGQIVDDLKRVGDQGDALFLMDRSLGARTGGGDDS
jgi:ferritin